MPRSPVRSRFVRSASVAAPAVVACVAAACGLSVGGTLAAPGDGGIGAGDDASFATDGAILADGASPGVDGALADATPGSDGAADVAMEAPPHVCAPFDSGVTGALALSAFALKGNAVFNENGDGIITLTNSNNTEHGAAWYPTPFPALGGYDLTWSLRVGPTNTAGDGVAFALLQSSGPPGVGDDGNGLGLRNVTNPDGGAVGGYAVIVDMYKDSNDPTDLDKTTLKLVAMPSFTYVAGTAVPVTLNDGNVHTVDVSWRAPSTLTATLHGPGGINYVATSSDLRFATPPHAFLGFTGSTGSASDSHNEAAGLSVAMTCN